MGKNEQEIRSEANQHLRQCVRGLMSNVGDVARDTSLNWNKLTVEQALATIDVLMCKARAVLALLGEETVAETQVHEVDRAAE